MIHEAIRALATKLRNAAILLHVCSNPRCSCAFLRELADELDGIAHAHEAEAQYRNEMMFS